MSVIEAVAKPKRGDVYAMVTDKIIEALEAGTVPWSKPWDPRIGMPLSMSTNKPYRGINVWLLGFAAQAANYKSPFWGTYKKIASLGGQVRKGEKSSLVTFWKTSSREEIVDGLPKVKRWAILRFYLVFNAEQADGLPEKFYKAPEGHEHDAITDAQAIIDGYVKPKADGPTFTHASGVGAYYSPFLDEIVVPLVAAFPQMEGYYSTCFHEMTHSTGHKSRLNREGVRGGHYFADEEYSKEELIAEMGAAMLCGTAGIDQAVRDRSAAYLQSWITTLRGDHKLVIKAAGDAQKAADHILGTVFEDDDE